SFLVLDEADRMVASGHFPQLDDIIRFIHGVGDAPVSEDPEWMAMNAAQNADKQEEENQEEEEDKEEVEEENEAEEEPA
ncbi:hypothetical protein, partial [Escherichia coli]|uniref:hypothetical protein n=1 Tax=Escherichia coli TaxID=562 RepID=UPI0028DF2899